ncbi:MAG: alkaline phosphatase, partial [Saprospiraceae bacterium]|nr:alkaline phosphatase [Saprospiraceae bacterium]
MKSVLILFLLLSIFACNKNIKKLTDNTVTNPKNIILLIGDGMGLGQITAGMIVNNNYTALEEFDVVGIHKSYAYDNLITDSAAAATAFACGVKTYNGAIGVNS